MQHRIGPNVPRTVRPAAVPGRRRQAGAEGGHRPEGGRQGRLHPGPGAGGDPGVRGVRGDPVRPGGRRAVHRLQTPLQLTDLPVGVLFILAVAVGRRLRHRARRLVVAARRTPCSAACARRAQMISYEVAMGLALVAVFLYAGSMSTSGIVAAQDDLWFGVHPAAVVRHLHDLDGGRDQPGAVRPARGRGRAGRRLPHRVLLAEVRAVLPRRVHQHGHRLGAGHHAVPRRLARAAGRSSHLGGRQRGLLAGAVVLRQGARSSSSSSSGCAARCRGCATTSSWRSAGRC